MQAHKKLTVFVLVLLLSLGTAMIPLPVYGDSWTDITLPFTITESGNYRITAPYTIFRERDANALIINASNVIVDGQNYLIQAPIRPLSVSLNPQTLAVMSVSIERGTQNVTLENMNIQGGEYGIAARGSSFTVKNSNFSNIEGYGIRMSTCSNFNIQGCNFTENNEGITGERCVNGTIESCYFNNNYIGVEMDQCSNCSYLNSMFDNSRVYALWDTYSENETISGNCFDHTGLSNSFDWEGTAVFLGDVDCTVSDNIILNNYNGFFWGVSEEFYDYTQLFYSNQFINNNNTMLLCRFYPGLINEELYFYNNFVNDTNYVNPYSFDEYNSGPSLPFESSILNFNTTLQLGTRIYSAGRMVGGNFWAHPDGTGPSQTGIDANNDGFIDAAFDLFDNASVGLIYDYFPYSSNYTANILYATGVSQHLTANQPSAQITIQTQDAFGDITSGATVSLSTNSTTGKFYSNPAATNQITSITIPAGECTASFYYKDTAAGSPVLTASSPNFTTATTQLSINASASVDHFSVSAPDSITLGSAFTVSINAIDAFGNNATSFTETVTLEATRGEPNPNVSGVFTAGAWSGQVILDGAGNITLTANDGKGHIGISNMFTARYGGSTATPISTPPPNKPTPTPSPSVIIVTVEDNGTINVIIGSGSNITVSQITGATLTGNQTAATTTLSFTVTGASGTTGFGNFTIAKTDVPYGSAPVVYIDGQPAAEQGYTQDSQNYYVWFTVHFSTHNVQVEFTQQTPTPTATVPVEASSATYGIIAAAIVAIVIVVALVLVAVKMRKDKKATA